MMGDTQNAIKCLSYCLKVLEQNRKLVENSQTGNSVAIIRAFKAGVESARQNKMLPFAEVSRQMSKAMLRASRGHSALLFSSLFKGATTKLNSDFNFDVISLHELTINGLKEMNHISKRLSIDPREATLLKTIQACSQVYIDNPEIDFISYIAELQNVCIARAVKPNTNIAKCTADDIIDTDSFCFCLFWYAASEFSKQLTLDELNIQENLPPQVKDLSPDNYIYEVDFTILRKNGLTVELLKRSLLDIGIISNLTDERKTFKLSMLTNTPQHIISYALKFGELTDINIKNLKV